MFVAVASLKSTAPYSQSRHYALDVPKNEKETHQDYEERTWRNRVHANKDGHIFIPPMSFKNCISEAAKFLGIQIPGKGKSNYTKHFEAGIMMSQPLVLPNKKDAVDGEWYHVPADGRRGGPKRVMKCFPVIPEWSGDVEFMVADETITKDVFLKHLKGAGAFIGIGRFRPRNNGYYGRFEVMDLQWSNVG